ncbi:uncharacterized protein EDB91DRAFT_1195154 [Suillus paluster]|uniref:uncharacterized protein n=1 Tax=Suillus paluster TaxID=48578 RepID=UPI001B86DE3D|nr:uncharacterized protein EDB91DRAFT_1195154 [Suillus paluster]KAG1752318.1 hypothetical protein EDB91DRAFT_1195154 [Suillus paluster]
MDVDPQHYDNRIEGGLYDNIVRQLIALPKGMSLGEATYKDDFVRDSNVQTGNFAYKCKDNGLEYETVLVGEILPRPCGTKLSAIGNHYIGTADTMSDDKQYTALTLTKLIKPNVIDDKTRVKGILVLGQPTQATEMMYVMFGNQIATPDDIIQSDIKELKRKNKDINIKEWTAHAGTDQSGLPEYIIVNTEQRVLLTISKVPRAAQQAMQGKRARVPKKELAKNDESAEGKTAGGTSSNDVETKGNPGEAAITTNTFYEPTILPDYGGDLFQHVNAKLRQLDIRNVNNDLIAPQEWYSSLKCGTLVMIRATLHDFNWKERRVYQLNAHTIRVMDPSNLEVEPISSRPNGFDCGANASSSKSRASDAMARVQLKKRKRED